MAYHLQVPVVLKSVSLNLLESSGPVQPCNGIALPFTFSIISADEVMMGTVGSFVTSGNSTALPVTSCKTVIFYFFITMQNF
jgi:hypothetical protein